MGLFKTEYCAICNEEIDVFAVIKLNKQENIQETSLSLADEIKKYKELLDTGAITQEEFESIKKKLL